MIVLWSSIGDNDVEGMHSATGIPVEVDEYLESPKSAKQRQLYEDYKFDSKQEEFDDQEVMASEEDEHDE